MSFFFKKWVWPVVILSTAAATSRHLVYCCCHWVESSSSLLLLPLPHMCYQVAPCRVVILSTAAATATHIPGWLCLSHVERPAIACSSTGTTGTESRGQGKKMRCSFEDAMFIWRCNVHLKMPCSFEDVMFVRRCHVHLTMRCSFDDAMLIWRCSPVAMYLISNCFGVELLPAHDFDVEVVDVRIDASIQQLTRWVVNESHVKRQVSVNDTPHSQLMSHIKDLS